VADLRAPTPSAAMEMILPDIQEALYTLSELQARFGYLLQEKIGRIQKALDHQSELIHRSSPLRRLQEQERVFQHLQNELEKALQYKIEHKASLLPEIRKRFVQNIGFVLQKKEEHTAYMFKKFELSDPKKQYKRGWAQISQNGVATSLDQIAIDEIFVLEDQTSRVEALCVNKVDLK
jgi:exodeoxyribonuclease VII large subunit